MIQLRDLSVRDLPKKSLRLPIESRLCEIPEVQECLKVIRDLKGKLPTCDKGMSGLFILQLQNLIGGEIYELNLHSVQGCFRRIVGHLFIYKDVYCYDSDGVCTMSLLKSMRRIKRTYTESSLKYVPQKEHYFLMKCSPEEIVESYLDGDFNIDFTPDEIEVLLKNTKKSETKLKVRKIFSKVLSSF